MQGFTYIDLIILVVYLAAVLFAGLHFAKKEMKGKPCRPDFLNEQGVVHQQADGIYFAGQYRRLSFSSRKTKRTNLRAVNASARLCWHLFTSLYLRW